MITLLLAALLAADVTVPRTPPPALTQDEELQAQHEGYLNYLAAHPDVAKAEQAWWTLQRDTAFHNAEHALDETLHTDIEAQTLFDRHYDRLYADADAKGYADALYRVEFNPGDLAPIFSDAMRELRADPRAALQQLEAGTGADLPDALAPVLDYLGENPAVLNELLGGLQGLTSDPLNAARVVPWWTQTAETSQGAGAAYAALTRHFATRPDAFWDWHRRNLALAADAQARDWIRYWHRKVRRTPGLAGPYYAWLSTHADLDRISLQRTAAKQNEDNAWPPKTAPPELPPVAVAIPTATPNTDRTKPETRLTTPRPQRTQVPRPTRPASQATGSVPRPTPPIRPTRPSAR